MSPLNIAMNKYAILSNHQPRCDAYRCLLMATAKKKDTFPSTNSSKKLLPLRPSSPSSGERLVVRFEYVNVRAYHGMF